MTDETIVIVSISFREPACFAATNWVAGTVPKELHLAKRVVRLSALPREPSSEGPSKRARRILHSNRATIEKAFVRNVKEKDFRKFI